MVAAAQNISGAVGGPLVSLRAGLNAGLMVGLWAGLVDGVVAGMRTKLAGFSDWLGCLAGAVLVYGIFWSVALALLGLLLHVWLWRRDVVGRFRVLLAIGIGGAIAAELYWWSREYLFWGLPATDPRRIAVGVGALAAGIAAGFVAVRAAARVRTGLRLAVVALVPLAMIGGALYVLAQKAQSEKRGVLNERNRDLPNVLLFVVDALRADVLGCYGNGRVHTPVIDGLAARGVLFERALVQAPFTWPSFGSILTGKYPRRHGLILMKPGVSMPPNVTLPWHLKHARLSGGGVLEPDDVTTAAFMTGTLSHGSGLARGFDAYYEQLVGHQLVEVESPWSVFRSELLLSIFENKLRQRFDEAPVASEACDWLEANGKKRFMAKVHFYSTHTPYDPPEPYRSRYVDPRYTGPIQAFYADARIAIEEQRYQPTAQDIQQIKNLYYAGVEQADAMIGQVLAELERQGTLDDTLVIVTGDHGEELGDHGPRIWEHNWMFQTNLRVPLVMAWPEKLPAGVRVSALVESIDIVPTVCALAGIEPPGTGASDELERIDGVSLLPLVRGEVERVRDYAFAENGEYLAVQDERFKLYLRAEALDQAGWQKALAGEIERPHFFDLRSDPAETVGELAHYPEDAARLLEALRAWNRSMPIRRDALLASERDRRAERLWRELGYTDGIGAALDDGHSQDASPASGN